MRFRVRLEASAIAIFYLSATAAWVYGTFKLIMWSYGGRDAFQFIVLHRPMTERWFDANPKTFIGRSTPLSDVPEYLETAGHGDPASQHPHHKNY